MASAAGLCRCCTRHPTRVLVILLLLVLVIASRFLFSSLPEQEHVHELNLVAGSLSEQHGHKHERKQSRLLNVNKNTVEQRKVSDIESPLKGKGKEKNLSEEDRDEIKDEDEKAENDLTQQKIPDSDRLHGNQGHLSPFEEAANDKELSERNPALGEMKNHDKKQDGLPEKNDGREKNRTKPKKSKRRFPQQEHNILMILAKVVQTGPLAQRFERCVLSVCQHTSVDLSFHVMTDNAGKLVCEDTFSQAEKVCKKSLNVTYYDVRKVAEEIQPIVKDIQQLFKSGDPNSYYNDPLFFLSTALHHVLPQTMMQIISLDSDLFFKADIKQLFAEFKRFNPSTVFGLAKEQQPVYRHVLHMFRNRNPGTKVGGPPPDGLTGFNSGVVLINLHNMRDSKLYNKLLQGSEVKEMAKKYTFQGNLGDQDFYTLLNLEYPELFHVLPCSWNRQLCTFWRDNGYADVFDSYFNCSEPIHVYHGNCGTSMPNE